MKIKSVDLVIGSLFIPGFGLLRRFSAGIFEGLEETETTIITKTKDSVIVIPKSMCVVTYARENAFITDKEKKEELFKATKKASADAGESISKMKSAAYK